MRSTPPAPVSEAPRITAVLNCYSPDGANRSQAVIRADGSVQLHGEETLAKGPLTALRALDLRRFNRR